MNQVIQNIEISDTQMFPYIPLSNKRESDIGAAPGANLLKRSIAPFGNRSQNGIDPSLELRGPPPSRVELGLKDEARVKRGVLAGLQPRLADHHWPTPSVLGGEPSEDVGEALVC